MTNLMEIVELMSRLKNYIIENDIQVVDDEETSATATVGGSFKRKTGRRKLIITIPYDLRQDYLMQQVVLLNEKIGELEAEKKMMEQSKEEIMKALQDLPKNS